MDWCNGFGLLILLTVTVYASLFYKFIVTRAVNVFLTTTTIGAKFRLNLVDPLMTFYTTSMSYKFSTLVIYVVVVVAFVVFLIVDTADDRRRLMSAFGIFILVKNFEIPKIVRNMYGTV